MPEYCSTSGMAKKLDPKSFIGFQWSSIDVFLQELVLVSLELEGDDQLTWINGVKNLWKNC